MRIPTGRETHGQKRHEQRTFILLISCQ